MTGVYNGMKPSEPLSSIGRDIMRPAINGRSGIDPRNRQSDLRSDGDEESLPSTPAITGAMWEVASSQPILAQPLLFTACNSHSFRSVSIHQI